MCLLIYKPKRTPPIPLSHLYHAFKKNCDGAGFAFVDPLRKDAKGRPKTSALRIHKGFMRFSHFMSCYRRWENRLNNESPFVIHFRWGTRGTEDKANCHPFYTKNGTCMAHNGVLSMPSKGEAGDPMKGWKNWQEPHDDESDTAYWARQFWSQFTVGQLRDVERKARLEKIVGTGNKFVFMNFKGQTSIYNMKEGHWEEGIWYSNHSYEGTMYNASASGYGSPCDNESCYDDELGWYGRQYSYDARRGFGGVVDTKPATSYPLTTVPSTTAATDETKFLHQLTLTERIALKNSGIVTSIGEGTASTSILADPYHPSCVFCKQLLQYDHDTNKWAQTCLDCDDVMETARGYSVFLKNYYEHLFDTGELTMPDYIEYVDIMNRYSTWLCGGSSIELGWWKTRCSEARAQAEDNEKLKALAAANLLPITPTETPTNGVCTVAPPNSAGTGVPLKDVAIDITPTDNDTGTGDRVGEVNGTAVASAEPTDVGGPNPEPPLNNDFSDMQFWPM